MTGASRLSGQRLGALAAALRVVAVLQHQRHRCQETESLALAEFLRDVSAGGPTAASSMHASLRWFADNFGAAFTMDHWSVKHFRFHAVHHTGKQAPELEPWNLLTWPSSWPSSRLPQAARGFLLMVATGCIRFEHVQRSRLVSVHSSWLEFECFQGKARKQGARPGTDEPPQVTWN